MMKKKWREKDTPIDAICQQAQKGRTLALKQELSKGKFVVGQ